LSFSTEIFRRKNLANLTTFIRVAMNKKAQLSLTNPRDAKACQKLLKFDVLKFTTLSLTILVYIRLAVVASEICKIPRNSLKIQTYRVQGYPRSSILVLIESAFLCTFLLVNYSTTATCTECRGKTDCMSCSM